MSKKDKDKATEVWTREDLEDFLKWYKDHWQEIKFEGVDTVLAKYERLC